MCVSTLDVGPNFGQRVNTRKSQVLTPKLFMCSRPVPATSVPAEGGWEGRINTCYVQVFSRYLPACHSSKLISEGARCPQGNVVVNGGFMDLSALIVAGLGILFFVGGAAWLEVHSRKNKRTGGRGEQPQPVATAAPAGRTGHGRVAKDG